MWRRRVQSDTRTATDVTKSSTDNPVTCHAYQLANRRS